MTVDHSVSDYTRETGLGWLKVIGLIPVPLFIGLIIAQAVVGSSAVFEPPYLLPALNILFLLIIPITVAVLCWLGYVHTGAVRILLIGCGMITLGFSSLAAGFAIDLPDGQNLVPIIHHTGALIASLFIIIASLLAVRYRPPHGPPAYGRSYAAAAYTCTLIIVALFIVTAFRGWIPPFFLPGSGFTILRMAVLGSAMALFALASILFLVSFARWSGFAYWYGLGLGLITIGLIAYLLTQAVGTPLGWTGRVAEYAGCVYMLIGIFSVARLSRLDGVPVADEMVESFSFSPASYNKLTKEHLAKLIQRYMDLFENSGTGIAIIDENGRFLMVNKRVAASFKKTVPEIIGLSLFDFLLRETAERYIELNRQLLLTGGRREYADTFVLPTGERTFLMVDTCLKDENGKYFAIQHSSVDITEKKRVEEALAASEAKYRSLVETSSAGVASIDVEGNLTFVNTKMCEMTGYQVEELIGRPFKAFLAPEELDKVMDMFTDGLAHPERYTALEFKGIHKNGSILWLYTSPRQLVLNGKLAGFATVIFDITDRKNKEGALQESEEKYRALFESSPLGITITDSEGNIVEANKESERLLGLTRDAQLQRKYDGPEWQIVRPDGTPMPANEYPSVRALRENRLIENVEMGIVKSGNEITWINVTAAPIPLKNYGVAITYGDITDRKQADEALRKSEQNYRILATYSKQLNDISITLTESSDIQDLFNRIAESFSLITGAITATFSQYNQESQDLKVVSLSIDPVSRHKVDSIFGPGLFEMRMPVSADVMEHMLSVGISRPKDLHELSFGVIPQEISDVTMEAIGYQQIIAIAISHGTELFGTCIAYLPGDQPAVPGFALKTYAYISGLVVKRRLAEEKLRGSESRYLWLSEHITDGVWLLDMNLKPTYQSPSMEKLTGFTHEELMELPFEKRVTPESFKLAAELYLELMPRIMADSDYNPTRTLELEYYCKDGTTLWTENKLNGIRDENGNPLFILAEVRDITKRKLSEEAILKSKILMQNVIDSTPDWIYVKDFQHKYMLVNKSFAQAQNMSPQDMIDRADTDFFSEELCLGNPDKDIIGYHADDNQAFQGHVVHNHRNIITWADGSQHTYDTYKFPLTDQSGKICGALVYSRDITQQSQAEEALQESENLYQSLFENMLNGFAYCRMLFEDGRGKDFVYIAVNSAFEKLTGLKNVTGKKISELIPNIWETDSELLEAYARVASTGIPETFEAYLAALNMWLYISVYSPEKEYFVAVFDVITDRKNMEIELQASHEEMRALAGNLQMAMESERKRVARMIHDDLAQTLTALQIELSGLTHKLPADHKQLSAQAAAMNRLITLMDERVKHITTELRPPLLDDLGLCAAVKLSLNEFSKRSGISHELHCDPEDFTLDTDIAIALFRVLQESLTNVTRHAEADMVTVHLKKLQECISLQIKDNGKGIEKRELSNKKSIGIIGMRERVAFFGGKLRITSSPGGGTTIDVKIPLGQGVTP